MRILLAVLIVSCVMSLAAPGRAEAQSVVVHYGSAGSGWNFVEPIGPLGYLPPYSYYTAYPNPARGYVGYTSFDFPYYGHAYGSPSDPWTWPYMSAAYNYGIMARYYYPPLR